MRRAVILIAAALMLSASCGRNCPAEVAVIPQPQVVETGRSTVVCVQANMSGALS